MNSFAWTDYYSELATVLLKFADDRKSLIEKIKAIQTKIELRF